MTDRLLRLIAALPARRMTDAEQREQRVSFAYGNLVLSDPTVTREYVDAVAAQMDREAGRG